MQWSKTLYRIHFGAIQSRSIFPIRCIHTLNMLYSILFSKKGRLLASWYLVHSEFWFIFWERNPMFKKMLMLYVPDQKSIIPFVRLILSFISYFDQNLSWILNTLTLDGFQSVKYRDVGHHHCALSKPTTTASGLDVMAYWWRRGLYQVGMARFYRLSLIRNSLLRHCWKWSCDLWPYNGMASLSIICN